MTDTFPIIYGIGNPLIDVVISAMDDDLKALKLNKGIMNLVDLDRQEDIIKYFKDKEPQYHVGMCRIGNTISYCRENRKR